MKKILLLLLLTVSFSSFCQVIEVTSKTWYVYEINKSGSIFLPPTDYVNFPYAKLNITGNSTNKLFTLENELMKNNCSKSIFAHVNFTSNGTDTFFNFTDFTPSSITSGCDGNDADMLAFMEEYLSFFQDNINENFQYFTQDVYGIENLKIWLPNGDYIWLMYYPSYEFVPYEIAYSWNLSKMIINGQE